MVVRVLAHVADIQNDRLATQVLPPMRCAVHFGPDVPGLVNDWIGAVAGVFDDFPLLHVNESRTVIVAVPWNNAAGFDRQLAKAQLAVVEVSRLLFEID